MLCVNGAWGRGSALNVVSHRDFGTDYPVLTSPSGRTSSAVASQFVRRVWMYWAPIVVPYQERNHFGGTLLSIRALASILRHHTLCRWLELVKSHLWQALGVYVDCSSAIFGWYITLSNICLHRPITTPPLSRRVIHPGLCTSPSPP